MEIVYTDDERYEDLFFSYKDKFDEIPDYGLFCIKDGIIVGAIAIIFKGLTKDNVPFYNAHWQFEKNHRKNILYYAEKALSKLPKMHIIIAMVMDKVEARFRASKIMAMRLGFKVIDKDENCSILRMQRGF